MPQTCATAVVEILDGEGAGDFQQVELPPTSSPPGCPRRATLVLTRDAGAEGGADLRLLRLRAGHPDHRPGARLRRRRRAVARLRGLASLVGLAFAFFILLQFVLPGLLAEESPTLVSLVGSAAIMFVVLYLAHGFSARTTTALVGTLFGLTLVAVLGSIAVSVARLTGLTSEETVTCRGTTRPSTSPGLVLAGIVVAGLGVLNDVTITQASAIWQLHEVSPEITWRELYTRGMTVGRDHIASTVYTIVFAYAGAALPLLLLFELSSLPVWTTVTSSALAEEVIRTLVGAIALVLAVPVTTAAGRVLRQGRRHPGRGGHRAPDDRPAGPVRPMSEAVAVSTDLLAAARAAPGFMPDDEGRALYEAARAVAVPGPLLEVGSWMGKSALYLAAAARETGRQVVTVDHHRGSEEHQPGWEYHDPSLVDPHVGLIDTLPRFRRTIADAGAEDVVVAVVTRSEVLAPLWSTPLALLFLDGSHTEESARRDQDAWVAKLAVGGTLAIHDVFPDPADGGPGAVRRLHPGASASGDFEELPGTGSLRLLRRLR